MSESPSVQIDRQTPVLKTLLDWLMVGLTAALLTFAATREFSFFEGVMVIWPVDGFILALMLGVYRRRPYLPFIACKASVILVSVWLGDSVPLSLGLSIFSGFSTLGIYFAMRRFAAEDRFTTSRWLLVFLAAASLASMNTALFGVLLYPLAPGVTLAKFFLTNATSNAVGYIFITPLLLMVLQGNFHPHWKARRAGPALGVAAVYCVFALIIFSQNRYDLLYIIPLGLMLVAYMADLSAVAAIVAATAGIAFTFAVLGRGPFMARQDTLIERILALQCFLSILAAAALPMAALMAEFRGLKSSLIEARIDAEAASRAKSEFLATISHEIRTPLNGLLGMTQAMGMGELSPPQREKLEIARTSGEVLLTLLNDVLDLSKIEAGKIVLENTAFDLEKLVSGVIDNFEATAQAKGLVLEARIGDVAGTYLGDPTRLRQILYNLISNALKFTEAGRVDLRCEKAPGGVEFVVSDTGIGIGAEKLCLLFGRFSQVDTSTTRRFGGSGLGLSICRELAELMGGGITVESAPGVGSTFRLTLPLIRTGDSIALAAAAPYPEIDAGEANLRILAAEDNPTNRSVLTALLQAAGLSATFVENGVQAIEAWRNGEWDLILMDVQMPVMDGTAAARAIRTLEAESRRAPTPIIALTANTLSHQIDQYLAAGMDYHLSKPIQAAALFEMISMAIGASASRAQDQAALRKA